MNPPVRFEGHGAALEVSVVPWDSEVFGFTVAQLDHLDLGPDPAASTVFADLGRWSADHDVRLISCRIDHTRLRESFALEAAGFRFIETVYGPRRSSLEDVTTPRHAVEVAEASAADLGPIEAIASSAFTTGRFLLDARLDPALSQRRYVNWVRTSFSDPRHSILKAVVDGELVGFFIVEVRGNGVVYWHLTAIAPESQGKGLGMSVWQSMLLRHRAEGATSIETTISGHNLAVLNLYASLGFRLTSAQMTFHWLRDEARPGSDVHAGL